MIQTNLFRITREAEAATKSNAGHPFFIPCHVSPFLSRLSPSSTRSTTASSAQTSMTRAPGTTVAATPAGAGAGAAGLEEVESPKTPVEAGQGGARPRPRQPDCTGKRENELKFSYGLTARPHSVAIKQTRARAQTFVSPRMIQLVRPIDVHQAQDISVTYLCDF